MTLLTDEEARAQICPLFRSCVNEFEVTRERVPAIYAHDPCQGSACKIGWRIAVPVKHAPTCASVATQADEKPADCNCAPEPARGFCGAFGTPAP